MAFLFFCVLLYSVLAQSYNVGQLLIGDQPWIDTYKAFGTFPNNDGQDFSATNTAAFEQGIHSTPFSFKNVDIPTSGIFLQRLVDDPTSTNPAGKLYIVLTGVTLSVFNLNTINQYELKSTFTMPASAMTTSYQCFDMIFVSGKVFIICNKGTPGNMVIVSHTIGDFQTITSPFTAGASFPLTNPRLVPATLGLPAGGTALFLAIWESLPNSAYLTNAQVTTALATKNYYVYFFNTADNSVTTKDIPISDPHKLLSLTLFSRSLLITHYRDLASTISGKASICTIPASLSDALVCQTLSTDYSLTAGYSVAVTNAQANSATLFYIETGLNIVALCSLSLNAAASPANSGCRTAPSAISTTPAISFDSFASFDFDAAVLVYKQGTKFAVADFVSKASSQSIAVRRRFNEDYVTGQGGNLLIGNPSRAALVNESSKADLRFVNSASAATVSEAVNMLLLRDSQTQSQTFQAQVIASTDLIVLPTYGGTMNGSTGYHSLLPYDSSDVQSNQAIITATSTDGDALVIFDNEIAYTLADGTVHDAAYPVGDALIGLVLNSSNVSYLRFYTCRELLNKTLALTCTFKTQAEVNGVAKFLYLRAQAIAAGQLQPADPYFVIADSVVGVFNFDDNVVVYTKDNATSPNHRLISFSKTSTSSSVFNATSTYSSLSLTKFHQDLFVAGVASGFVDGLRAANFDLGVISQVRRYDKTNVAGDLCPLAAQISSQSQPRLKIISQCSAGNEYLLDRELYPNVVRGITNFFQLIQENPPLATTIKSCIAGQYFLYWKTTEAIIYGQASFKTDKIKINLSSKIPGAFTDIFCLGGSGLLAVIGLDSSSKQNLFVIRPQTFHALRRIPLLVTFNNAISNIMIMPSGTSDIYMTYTESSVAKARKFSLGGPLVFANSTNANQAKVSVKVDNVAQNSLVDVSVQFASVIQTASVSKISSTPISIGTFNLESLYKVSGPVFSLAATGFDASKLTFIPRVSQSGTLSYGQAATSSLKINELVGIRVQYYSVNTYLLLYRDPETLRANISTEFYVDSPAAGIQDKTEYTAYLVAEGVNLTQRIVMIYRAALVTGQYSLFKAFFKSEISSSDLSMRYIKDKVYQVTQFSKLSQMMVIGIFDLNNINTDWKELSPSKKDINPQGSTVLPSYCLFSHQTRQP